MAKKRKTNWVLCLFALFIGAAGGFFGLTYFTLPLTDELALSEEIYFSNDPANGEVVTDVFDADISIHFLELGNKFSGDCTYIKTKEADILIDCGSKTNSISTVSSYLDKYVTDGTLEYVIVTHAHQDHYAGFATSEKVDSIFDLYDCEVIIDFARTNQKENAATYSNYKRELQDEIDAGALHYTALQCVEESDGAKSSYEIGDGITLNILDSYFYRNNASTENDYSVCTLITQTFESGENKNFLFTGDLESDGEAELVKLNNLPNVDLFKAGHHGSYTSSTETLLSVIKPKVVCVCCCAGGSEYTDNSANQFPSQDFINRIAPYTTAVFVTSLAVDYENNIFTWLNGDIVCFVKDEELDVRCSNNNTFLKDTDWFKQNRECPSAWKT